MAANDAQIRLAAFRFLEEQQRLAADQGVLSRKVLVEGFVHEGERVPLMGPQGIFKPRVLRDIPLSITTVAVVEGGIDTGRSFVRPECLRKTQHDSYNKAERGSLVFGTELSGVSSDTDVFDDA